VADFADSPGAFQQAGRHTPLTGNTLDLSIDGSAINQGLVARSQEGHGAGIIRLPLLPSGPDGVGRRSPAWFLAGAK